MAILIALAHPYQAEMIANLMGSFGMQMCQACKMCKRLAEPGMLGHEQICILDVPGTKSIF